MLKHLLRRQACGEMSMAVVDHRTATFTVAGNRLDAAREASRTDHTVFWLGLLSVLYNGILAFINHNIVPLSMTHVAASEGLIMASAIIYILHKGIYETDLLKPSCSCCSRSS